ncbi:Cupin domain-containing protein [Hymenobacter daecheongensis DSM 21074]|uniref:Cupin domain-containing protein n=1 Tax=Hymenobacter daecheongensis DSM 21074 TaxID=1121955 RepID=A0A1M6J826_9BACT|nr:cupin domain-containing protein [Hymenobacter daecheongensis]SHJ42824.1 Cupin domain-containing protein [Hymenobacter daecheongensis DSM 21074]
METPAFLCRPQPLTTRAIPGGLYTFLARGSQTQQRFALAVIRIQAGAEPPAHCHVREDETFYLQRGRVRFRVGDNTLEARPGDCVYLPKGVPHAFEVTTPDAEMLIWISPAGFDEWLWTNSAPAPDGQALPLPQGPPPPEVIAEFVRTLADYGVELLPPGAPLGRQPTPATELLPHQAGRG